MKTYFYYLKFMMPLIFVALVWSCKDNYNFNTDELSKNIQINTKFSLPVAFAKMTLADLIKEKKDTIIFNSDKSVLVRFKRDSIFSVKVSDIYKIPSIQSVSEFFELGDLNVGNFLIERAVTLNEFSTNIKNGGNVIQQLANQVQPVYLPSITSQDGGSYIFSPFTDFRYARFSQGYLEISLTNNFGFSLENVQIELVDNETGTVIFSDFKFTFIAAGATAKDIRNMANIKLSNNLKLHIKSIGSQGSGSNPLDKTKWVKLSLTDKLVLNAKLGDMQVREGEAIVSQKTITPDNTEVDWGNLNEHIYKAVMKAGKIKFNIRSEVQTQVEVKLTFPTVTLNNVPKQVIVPITYTGTSVKTVEVDLAKYTIDLTKGSKIPYNTLLIEYEIANPGPRTYTTFKNTDRFFVDATFEGLDFSYVEGYIGQKTVTITPGTVDLNIDFFKDIDGGLILTNPLLKLLVTNSIGIPLDVNLNLTGKSNSGKSAALNQSFSLVPPTTTEKEKSQTINFDRTNSNIVDFIALPPSKVTYSGGVVTNKNTPVTATNFVYGDSRIKVGMQLDLPLELKTDKLVLTDTTDVNIKDGLENAQTAKLFVQTVNGFPLDAQITLVMYDSKTKTNLSTISSEVLKSGKVTNGKVNKGDETTNLATIELNKTQLDNLQKADRLIISTKLNTASSGTIPVTLYTDYSLELKLAIEVTAFLKL